MAERIECKQCEGWGWLDSDVTHVCAACDGRGSINIEGDEDGE